MGVILEAHVVLDGLTVFILAVPCNLFSNI